MVELNYSFVNRSIEQCDILETARKNNIDILAFGVLSHGILSYVSAGTIASGKLGLHSELKRELLAGICENAWEKNTTVEKLAQAYVYAKNPDMSILIGTTRKVHLQDSIDTLVVDLSGRISSASRLYFQLKSCGV
jgi:aryl-alcohol dehydrogenase-like predicted oxidoreductase